MRVVSPGGDQVDLRAEIAAGVLGLEVVIVAGQLDRPKGAADSSAVPLRVSLIRRKALSGRSDAAAADLKALERDAANKVIRFTARDQGYVHLALGNVDQALSAFENALDERDPALVWFGVDPRLDDVRSHPRFQAILQRMKMP